MHSLIFCALLNIVVLQVHSHDARQINNLSDKIFIENPF